MNIKKLALIAGVAIASLNPVLAMEERDDIIYGSGGQKVSQSYAIEFMAAARKGTGYGKMDDVEQAKAVEETKNAFLQLPEADQLSLASNVSRIVERARKDRICIKGYGSSQFGTSYIDLSEDRQKEIDRLVIQNMFGSDMLVGEWHANFVALQRDLSKINDSETIISVKSQPGLEENEEKLPQIFTLKENLLGSIEWSFGAPGATLNPTPEGKKLVTNTTKSMQLTKNFTTNKAQKVQIPFNIDVTKGEVTVSLYEFGKRVPVQGKSLGVGDTPNGVLEFDVPGAQTLTVVISNELDGQASECTLKELRILVEEKL